MTAPAQHSAAQSSEFGSLDDDERDLYGELVVGERLGPPRAGTARKVLRRLGFVVLIALAVGWAVLGDTAGWLAWFGAQVAAISSSSVDRPSGSVQPTALAVATPLPNSERAPATYETAPATKERALDAPPTTLKSRAASSAADPTTTAPAVATRPRIVAKAYDDLPTPVADPADPYQMRAVAVGLHPGLSRVLLSRLSPADYRNAGIAIKTAVAETPDGSVFVWPRQRKPGLAVFEVHFVPGAAPDCRRYVVSVAKDGWLTTALPMEKCVRRASAQRRE
jgi:hypothetical protein